jgi:thioredoxin reductase
MGRIEPHKAIDVLIVGTGLAGLTATLECHRKGMSVRLLEKYLTLTQQVPSHLSLRSYHPLTKDLRRHGLPRPQRNSLDGQLLRNETRIQ